MFLGSLQHGACVVIPTSMAFSAIELGDMITRCGLNRLNQFAPFLVHHLRAARSDPKVFSLLDNLDELLYSGALPREEEDWGFRSGLKLRVSIAIPTYFLSFSLTRHCRTSLAPQNAASCSCPGRARDRIQAYCHPQTGSPTNSDRQLPLLRPPPTNRPHN